MMYESYESEKLKMMIEDKKRYLQKQTNKVAGQFLQKEIMFLEHDILPVVLSNTIIHFSQIARYITRCFDEAINFKCGNLRVNGLLAYLPVWSEYGERPIIAIANHRKPKVGETYGEGLVEISAGQVEIQNMDGSGVDNIECFTLDIDGDYEN